VSFHDLPRRQDSTQLSDEETMLVETVRCCHRGAGRCVGQSVGNYLADMATKPTAARRLTLYAAQLVARGGI
jgi:hypothetical protein